MSSVGRFPHLQKYVNIQRFIFNGQPFVDFAGKIFQTYLLASPKLSPWQMNATNAGILYILYILIALFFVFSGKKIVSFWFFFTMNFFVLELCMRKIQWVLNCSWILNFWKVTLFKLQLFPLNLNPLFLLVCEKRIISVFWDWNFKVIILFIFC